MSGKYDLLVRGGTVVTEAGPAARDVGIRDGRIAAIGDLPGDALESIDATGRLVLPGGVDAHCHVDQVSSTGLRTADDFFTAGVSAACGGTTTIIPFAAQHRGQSLRQVVREYHAAAEGRAFVDYSFHLILSDTSAEMLTDELPALIREGYASLKVYMTYDALRLTDRQILDVLAVAKRERALTLFHAENHDAIAWITALLLAEGRTAPKYHALARPQAAEREATARACMLAELLDAPIVIVHVSCGSALDEIRRARRRGVTVHAETCPQYLTFTAADLDRPGSEGTKWMFSPPARDAAAQTALWRGLADGAIDIFSSDHAPYRFDGPDGKKANGEDAPFDRVPNGVPGLELRMPLLFSEGVAKGRIGIERFVELTATNPARLYGLYPRKGCIRVGADADLAVWDPDRDVTVTQWALHDRMDYTPYEGTGVRGWPATTVSRGEIVWMDGELRGEPGRGRFVQRGPASTEPAT